MKTVNALLSGLISLSTALHAEILPPSVTLTNDNPRFGTAMPVADASPFSQSEIPAPQIGRFTVWLDILDKQLIGITPEDAADRLVASGARAVTFNLQALGRLYADENPAFEKIRIAFKSLEDGIGGYQKWTDLERQGRESGVSPSVLARLQANRDTARIVFVKALTTTQFVPIDGKSLPYTQTLRNFLNNYAWKDVAKDRDEVLNKLILEIENIRTASYDFSHLEDGNGVHEFRRKMRWISMETRALNGMIKLKPIAEACPVPEYSSVVFDPIAQSKYAVLPGSANEPSAVALTPCLYVMVAKLVEDVNQIKAKAELEDSFAEGDPTDAVSISEQAKVQAMLDGAFHNDLFGRLQKELARGLSAVESETAPLD